jgi:hypothetical protein
VSTRWRWRRAQVCPFVCSAPPKAPGNSNIHWTFGGSGYRHVWIHQHGVLFFGMGSESNEGDAGVQSIGSAVVNVTPGDYFELIARQTSGATKNVAADELTWLAIEVE